MKLVIKPDYKVFKLSALIFAVLYTLLRLCAFGSVSLKTNRKSSRMTAVSIEANHVLPFAVVM